MSTDNVSPTSSSSETDGSSLVAMLGPLGAKRGDDGTFTRPQVWLKVAVIVLYIVIATVWFPSYLMEPNSLAVIRDLYSGLMSPSTWDTILGLIASGVWFVALAVAFVGMRLAQKERLI